MFSDECFVRPSKTGIEFCRKFDHEDWCDERFVSETQQAELSIHIWGAISSGGLLDMEWLNPKAGETADSDH